MNYPIKASLPPAILFAIVGVVVLYAAQLLVFPEVDSGMYYRIVWGNAISPVIVAIFLTAMFLLFSKRRKLGVEKKMSTYFLSDVGPRLFDHQTRIEDVTDQYPAVRDNLLVHRWRQMQLLINKTTNSNDMQGVQNHAENETEHLQNSYSLPRYFVWALPIVGFIGTVWGIGLSISFFSDTMSSSQAGASVSSMLQQNIPLVTKGLSTAFDTTLLALVLSVPVTGFLVMTERDERDYLLGLDEQWRRFLAMRPNPAAEFESADVDHPDHHSHAQAVGETLRDLREDAFDHYQQRLNHRD